MSGAEDSVESNETADATGKSSMDRRALVKSLGKAALLPALVGVFVASDTHDAAAS